MGNLKNTISNKYYLKKKKPSTLIRVLRNNKNLLRESVLTIFLWEKYEWKERNDIEFIQNKI